MQKSFTITKKITKQGNQFIIVIPRFLQQDLKPKTIIEVKINIIKGPEK